MDRISEVVPISDLRHRQNEVLARLSEGVVILTQRGRDAAVMMSLERWNRLIEHLEFLEDGLDAVEIKARVDAGEEPTYSHEEVWAEIGELETQSALPD